MSENTSWHHLTDIARQMNESDGLVKTMEAAVEGAVKIIADADHAGISLVHGRGRIETPAATSETPNLGVEMQYELGEGPCLQSIRTQESVQSDNLTLETRWPQWSQRASSELGIRSMLCFRLFVTDDTLGALSLYSNRVDAFDSEDRTVGLALAAQIAVAVASARYINDLENAVANRTVIGQAQGMLMQRFDVSPDQAFAVLSRASQNENRTIHDIAGQLVAEGIKFDLL